MLLLGGFSCVAAALFVASRLAMRPANRINANSCYQIEKGMTRLDVETLLGVPAGDHSTRAELYRHPVRPSRNPSSDKTHPTYWISDEVIIALYFDDDNCVDGWSIDSSRDLDESVWAKFRRWVRLK
jgi:hypothetical protein